MSLVESFLGIFKSSKNDSIPALTGLRSLMTFWVISFHIIWHMGYHLPKTEFINVIQDHPILENGYIAVDVFFVLTGFLLAYPVFLKGGLRFSMVPTFISKRLVRITPLLVVVTLLYCFVIFPNGLFDLSLLAEQSIVSVVHFGSPGATTYRMTIFALVRYILATTCSYSWLNILFLNNFFPFGGCMGWTWSLAIQGQFYVFFPILIAYVGIDKKFWRLIAFIILGNLLLRIIVFFALLGDALPPFAYNMDDLVAFFKVFVFLYSNTFTRIGTIYCGVAFARLCVPNLPKEKAEDKSLCSGHIFENSLADKFSKFLEFHSVLRHLLLALAFCVIACNLYFMHLGKFGQDAVFTIVFAIGGIGLNLTMIYILFIIIFQVGIFGKFLNSFLSMKLFQPLATLSYAAYLVHPIILIYNYSTFLFPLETSRNFLWYYFSINWSLILIVSTCCYIFIEVPTHRFFINRGI